MQNLTKSLTHYCCPLVLLTASVFVFTSCTATPYNAVEYHSRRSPGEIAADREHIEQMAARDRANRREEMMDEADAVERATQHNPTHVTTNQTNFLWW